MRSPSENAVRVSCYNVLLLIWVVEFDGDTHFLTEERSRSGGIRSKIKIQNFLTKKHAYLIPFVLAFNNVIYFYVRQ